MRTVPLGGVGGKGLWAAVLGETAAGAGPACAGSAAALIHAALRAVRMGAQAQQVAG